MCAGVWKQPCLAFSKRSSLAWARALFFFTIFPYSNLWLASELGWYTKHPQKATKSCLHMLARKTCWPQFCSCNRPQHVFHLYLWWCQGIGHPHASPYTIWQQLCHWTSMAVGAIGWWLDVKCFAFTQSQVRFCFDVHKELTSQYVSSPWAMVAVSWIVMVDGIGGTSSKFSLCLTNYL